MTLPHPEDSTTEAPVAEVISGSLPRLTKTSTPNEAASPRRWWALAVIAFVQLVLVLDATIVSIALPWAQIELQLSDGMRQWVITAYELVFGSMLLLGGRVADSWGRKRAFMLGLIGFGAASLYGGLAGTGVELLIARGLQGLFAALLAPAALALLTVTFPFGRERGTAFAVYGALSASGAGVGYLLGGFLTEYANWRWCLLINLVFVAFGALGGALVLRESRSSQRGKLDIAGALTVTLGFGALVYGFTLAEFGWVRVDTLGFLGAGLVLLSTFVWIEHRAEHPLLPLRVLTHRVRAGAFLVQALLGSVLIGTTLYITLLLQLVLGIPPLLAGLGVAVQVVTTLAVTPVLTSLLPRIGPRPMLIVGPLIAAIATFVLVFVTPTGGYWSHVFPGVAIFGIGIGITIVPLQNLALVGVRPSDAGAASAAVSATFQIGGSIGLAVFSLAAAAATTVPEGSAAHDPAALASGFSAVFAVSTMILLVAAALAALLVRGTQEELMPSHGEGR